MTGRPWGRPLTFKLSDWTPFGENFNILEIEKVMTGHPLGRPLTFELSDWTPFGGEL